MAEDPERPASYQQAQSTVPEELPSSTNSPSTTHSTPPNPSGRSPSRRKDPPCASRVEVPSSYFDPLLPRTLADEH